MCIEHKQQLQQCPFAIPGIPTIAPTVPLFMGTNDHCSGFCMYIYIYIYIRHTFPRFQIEFPPASPTCQDDKHRPGDAFGTESQRAELVMCNTQEPGDISFIHGAVIGLCIYIYIYIHTHIFLYNSIFISYVCIYIFYIHYT